MRTILLLFFLSLFSLTTIFSQTFDWVKTFRNVGPANNSITANSVSTDSSGNIFVAGNFQSAGADVDPDSGTCILSSSNKAAFVVKLDTSGQFLWYVQIGCDTPFSSAVCYDMETDHLGNVFMAIIITGVVCITEFGYVTTENMCSDLLIIKILPDGNIHWVKQLKGIPNSGVWYSVGIYGANLALDDSGNVLVTGDFFREVDFDPGPLTSIISGGLDDIFVLKLNTIGDLLWVKHIAGSVGNSNPYISNPRIVSDQSGNSFVSANFKGVYDLDPDTSFYFVADSIQSTQPNMSFFILKLDAHGNFIWAKQFANGYSQTTIYCYDVLFRRTTQTIICTGTFKGTFDFDPGNGTFILSSPSTDSYILETDSSGNLMSAMQFYSNTNTPNSTIFFQCIKSDIIGNLYLGGGFAGSIDLNPGMGVDTSSTNPGCADGLTLKLDPNFNFLWANTFHVFYAGPCPVYDVAVDLEGKVISTGFWSSTVDFVHGPAVYPISAVGTSTFIHKLYQSTTGVFDQINSNKLLVTFPNPANESVTVRLQDKTCPLEDVRIFDIAGKDQTGKITIHHTRENEIHLKLNVLSTGAYNLNVRCDKGYLQTRIFIVR